MRVKKIKIREFSFSHFTFIIKLYNARVSRVQYILQVTEEEIFKDELQFTKQIVFSMNGEL